MLRVFVRAPRSKYRFDLPNREVTIGSAPDNDWVLPCTGVSRHHATAVAREGTIEVRDLGSKNGLLLGDRQVSRHHLQHGQQLRIGSALISLEDDSTSEAELGIAFEPETRRARLLEGASTLEGPEEVEELTPDRAALSLAREVASLERPSASARRWALNRALDILGTETLLVAQIASESDLGLHDVYGTLPSDELLAELHRERQTLIEDPSPTSRSWLLAPARPGRRVFLAAKVDVEHEAPPVWKEMLLDFLAAHLLEPVEPVESTALPASAGETLLFPEGMVVGTSPAMTALLAELRAVVASTISVLLWGETGTGKELLARTIHASSAHASGPFIPINCAAIPAELLEAELFGVEKRAATGVDPSPGRFLQADGGTLFLDEIGDLPLPLQPKLLRALQEQEVLAVGAKQPTKIDVRIVAASSFDLRRKVTEGGFSDALFYRLAGVTLRVPPLRERQEDLAPLLFATTEAFARQHGRALRGISRRALAHLLEYRWPGNIRELKNEIAAAVLRSGDCGTLRSEHLSDHVRTPGERHEAETHTVSRSPESAPTSRTYPANLRGRREAEERSMILDALRRSHGVLARAARELGITRQGLAYKMKKLGIRD